MKIAQVVCVYPPYRGGIGTAAYQFSRQLSDFGHEVVVFTPRYNKLQDIEKQQSVQVVRLKPMLKYGNAAFIPQLIYKLRNFDMVYLHYPFFGSGEAVWLAKILLRKSFKLAIHYHMDVGALPLIVKLLRIPSKLIVKSLFKQADIITCASPDYVKHSSIKKIYHSYKTKFFELTFGVDIDKFCSKPVTKEGNIPKLINIIFVGGLDQAHYFKGLEVLLESVSKLDKTNWQLSVVGSGDRKEYFVRLVESLRINKQIRFLGGLTEEELIEQYQIADFLVLPSINRNEAFGIVLLEAMACGLPVIAGNLPGVRKVFTPGREGYLVEPGNAVDLLNKIKLLMENSNKRQEMGLAGRHLVEEKYSLNKLTRNLSFICEQLK